MHQTRPLPDTHREFTVIHYPGFTEYKVENWRLVRDGSGRVRRGTTGWSWFDASVLVVIAAVWNKLQVHNDTSLSPTAIATSLALALAFVWLIWTRCTQVLHESILVFPTLGIQLETHRGHPYFSHPLTITRNFIHLSSLEDVIIHEGFRRWNVRYYLAAIRRSTTRSGSGSGVTIHVGFENILPYFPVLRHVYLGVQETLCSQSRSQPENENEETL